MPIYEFRCGSCGEVSSFFTRSIGAPLQAVCSHCGSEDMQQRMSSFAMGKTTGSVHDSFSSSADPHSPEYYSDPRNIGRDLEAGFKRYGMDMPQGVREKLEAAREGELPKGMDT